MNAWRVVPLDPSADPDAAGGALWVPRELQGAGRHDNPDLYGCLYLAEDPVSAIAEHLAPFRGTGRLTEPMLTKFGRRLILVEISVPEAVELIDLDDPGVLNELELRPSRVATRHRGETQARAAELYTEHSSAGGVRWWSTLEASWINLTVFDRGSRHLRVEGETPMTVDHQLVIEAAETMGLRPTSG